MDKAVLKGIRVLEFSQAAAGPYAGLLLAFLGAEVIRIESRKRLDHHRREVSGTTGQILGENQSLSLSSLHANKLSVTLDLTQPKGVELLKRLVKVSNLVLENFRPGVMDNFGLGYAELKKLNPSIIMASLSNCGQTGPERRYPGTAAIFNAVGGVGHMTGYADGPPTELRASTDLRSGTTLALAIIAALYYQRKTGKGQNIDLSAREAITCFVGDILLDYILNNRVQSRSGNRDSIMAPHNCYRCKGEDKWVSIAVATNEEWRALCEATGNPEWVDDERFSDAYSRWHNQEELDRLIGEWTINHTHYEVMEILQKVGVAAVPAFNSEELLHDSHLRERGLFIEVDHPETGKNVVVGPPWKLSATPACIHRHGPLLGEHNEYVFGELLGMSHEEIQRLAEEGIFY